MMKAYWVLRWRWIVLVGLGVAALIVAFVVAHAKTHIQPTEVLAARLRDKGVPVKSVRMISQTPPEIEITLQSSSDGKQLAPEDLWYAQLARREAVLASRIGIQLTGFTLTIINDKGDVLETGWEAVAGRDFSRRTVLPPSIRPGDTATENVVKAEFDFEGMTLDSLEISSDALKGMGQSLIMQLSVPNIEAANRVIPSFLLSVRPRLESINSQHGTNVVLCWIQIRDQKGNLLVADVVDLETGTETSSQVEGIDPWYPVPAPTYVTPTPTSSAPAPALPSATSPPADNPYP